MDLARLSLPQLVTFHDALSLIRQGAELLTGLPVSEGGDQLTICLRPGSLVSIETSFRMPIAADFEPPSTVVRMAMKPDLEPPCAVPCRVDPPAAKETLTDAPLTSGPYSDLEKETIKRMHLAGASNADIADALRRSPTTVALARSRVAKALEASAKSSAVNAPAPPPAVVPSIPARQFEIKVALDRVKRRKGFDAELDLEIVEGYTRNQDKTELALMLGIDGHEMRERYRDLISVCTDRKGQISADDIQHLQSELRRRVALSRVKVSPAV